MIRPSRLALALALPLALNLLAAAEPAAVAPTPPAAAGPAPKADLRFPWQLSPEERATLQQKTDADHRDMLARLGITKLRPGRNGMPNATTNLANYDEAQANPYPDYPDALTLSDGRKVTTAAEWWQTRRPELVELFEREVVGRVPAHVPAVNWSVTETVRTQVGGIPVVARRVVGTVDNSACPQIDVEIRMSVVTPAEAKGPVPTLIMFGFGNMPDEPAPRFGPPGNDPSDPPSTEQLIAAGWGYVSLSPNSVQADHGAGLTAGIIGLANCGQRRKPDDWGALRAWAWGASRALDYLETDKTIDAKKVGIEGVSRFGKAALVTMAFDPRFAVALVASSGEGGVKPHRRNFGEAVENLTSSGAYHWMAGNFLKYGAEESKFGRRTAADIPVESHQLIALCAPRPTFISYGIPEKGDAHWLDQQGSYMATVAAGPVYRLLGARDVGDTRDYRVAKMPGVNVPMLDGELAWRQHDGGHESRSNMKHFISWANRMLKISSLAVVAATSAAANPAAAPAAPSQPPAADQPAPRGDKNSQLAHEQLVAKTRQGKIDVYFLGDSITRRWGGTDYPHFLEHWTKTFHGWNAANFGWGGDATQNILWRIQNGEMENIDPKVVVLLAGTNNIGPNPSPTAADAVPKGIKAILDVCRQKAPNATIVLMAIFPRNDGEKANAVINKVNEQLATFADGKRIRFLNINDRLADPNGTLKEGVHVDKLHLAVKGYEIWGEALKPILTELLGPPAAEDQAPPPTGDPSAKK